MTKKLKKNDTKKNRRHNKKKQNKTRRQSYNNKYHKINSKKKHNNRKRGISSKQNQKTRRRKGGSPQLNNWRKPSTYIKPEKQTWSDYGRGLSGTVRRPFYKIETDAKDPYFANQPVVRDLGKRADTLKPYMILKHKKLMKKQLGEGYIKIIPNDPDPKKANKCVGDNTKDITQNNKRINKLIQHIDGSCDQDDQDDDPKNMNMNACNIKCNNIETIINDYKNLEPYKWEYHLKPEQIDMTTRSRFPSYYNKKNATSEAVVDSTVSDNIGEEDNLINKDNEDNEEDDEDNEDNEDDKDYVYRQPS